MINIFNSTSIRATSTTQDLLNDLSTRYDDWYEVVYDTTITTNVSQLWVSQYIYLDLSSDSSARLKVSHTGGATSSSNNVFTKYNIITTDKGVMVTNQTVSGSTAVWFAIGKTTDPNGASSQGVVFDLQSGSVAEYTYTDHMTLDNYSFSLTSSLGKSRVNTVLAPIYSVTGDEYFDDIMLVILSKDTDAGKVSINNKYYYLNEAIALPYTP